MTEAIRVTPAVLERVKGIIPDDVIERWVQKKEIIVEENDDGNKN